MTEQELEDTAYGRGLGLPGCVAYSQAELDAAVAETVAAERHRCVVACKRVGDESPSILIRFACKKCAEAIEAE